MSSSLQVQMEPARGVHDPAVDVPAFLDAVGTVRRMSPEPSKAVIYSQGDPADQVFHIQHGTVKKSVLSRDGRDTVIAVLGPGDFLGEECLAGQQLRTATASSLTEGSLLVIEKQEMLRLLHGHAPIADWFLSHTLARLTRIEDDLADQRCNLTEKRLARTLLLLARYGQHGESQWTLPTLSQTMLAEMVGTTRSRVNFFLNKFKRQGFIAYDDNFLTINRTLQHVVWENESHLRST